MYKHTHAPLQRAGGLVEGGGHGDAGGSVPMNRCTNTHTQRRNRSHPYMLTHRHTHLCSELVGSLMVAGMVMRVRSLPIMFFISDQRLKPLPKGRGMGRRVRTPLDCDCVKVIRMTYVSE